MEKELHHKEDKTGSRIFWESNGVPYYHNVHGPAVVTPDGTELFCLNGFPISEEFYDTIESKEDFLIEDRGLQLISHLLTIMDDVIGKLEILLDDSIEGYINDTSEEIPCTIDQMEKTYVSLLELAGRLNKTIDRA